MNKKIASLAVAAAALGATAALVPAVASAQDEAPVEESAEEARAGFLADALQPLVDDGTITAGQAAAVGEAIREAAPARGPRHKHFGGSEVLTDVLGVDQEALREALMSGQSVADIAAENGVDVQTVIDTLVAEANVRLDEAVAEGKIDAADADEKRAQIEERVTAMVNGEFEGRRHGRFGPGAGEDVDA
jgi:hypothetical protein